METNEWYEPLYIVQLNEWNIGINCAVVARNRTDNSSAL